MKNILTPNALNIIAEIRIADIKIAVEESRGAFLIAIAVNKQTTALESGIGEISHGIIATEKQTCTYATRIEVEIRVEAVTVEIIVTLKKILRDITDSKRINETNANESIRPNFFQNRGRIDRIAAIAFYLDSGNIRFESRTTHHINTKNNAMVMRAICHTTVFGTNKILELRYVYAIITLKVAETLDETLDILLRNANRARFLIIGKSDKGCGRIRKEFKTKPFNPFLANRITAQNALATRQHQIGDSGSTCNERADRRNHGRSKGKNALAILRLLTTDIPCRDRFKTHSRTAYSTAHTHGRASAYAIQYSHRTNHAIRAAIAALEYEPLVMGAKIAPMPRLKLKHWHTGATIQKGSCSATAEGGEGIRKNLLQQAQYPNKSFQRRYPPRFGAETFLT